jgi:hypothetical protein
MTKMLKTGARTAGARWMADCCPSFDLHRTPNVVRSIGGDGGIPKQQALPVRIVWIGFDASKIGRHLGGLKQSSEQGRKLLQEWAVNVILARLPNGVETRCAFFAAQRLQLHNRGRLAKVFAKDGDVDVFREARNQSVPLGERGSAFE